MVAESGEKWSIALVNRHPTKEVACSVKMKLAFLAGRYQATILAGDSPEAFNDIEQPDRVVPEKTQLSRNHGVANLLPHSLTIFQTDRK